MSTNRVNLVVYASYSEPLDRGKFTVAIELNDDVKHVIKGDLIESDQLGCTLEGVLRGLRYVDEMEERVDQLAIKSGDDTKLPSMVANAEVETYRFQRIIELTGKYDCHWETDWTREVNA